MLINWRRLRLIRGLDMQDCFLFAERHSQMQIFKSQKLLLGMQFLHNVQYNIPYLSMQVFHSKNDNDNDKANANVNDNDNDNYTSSRNSFPVLAVAGYPHPATVYPDAVWGHTAED